jgi:tRNA(Ile)-lysidine synthase
LLSREPALAAPTIDALFAPLSDFDATLLAVSGGPDSTALLAMAVEWAHRAPQAPRIAAATVDHGLRNESAAEAAAVGALCARLGVPHRVLLWQGDKPTSRIQERARAARYALLGAHAREIGARAIVTAHHLDDQAETALFRLLRGSGVGGLRAMAASVDLDGVALLRPLLGVAKRDLVACCEVRGLDYVRDPSNDDPRYARTRMRKLAANLAEEGLDAAALARLARRAGQIEDALTHQTRSAAIRLGLGAGSSCDAAALLAEPTEIVQRLLAEAIADIGGRPPNRVGLAKVEALTQQLARAFAAGAPFSANVAGARVRLARGDLRVAPEPPRRPLAQPRVRG